MIKIFTVAVLAGLTGVLFSGCARKVISLEEGWDLLGQTKVDFIRDKDEIDVNNNTLYTALRFRVEDRDVRLNYVKIIFDNGDKLEPAIDEEIVAGQNSRLIDLGDQGRIIDKIEFRYRTTGSIFRGRAEVLVFGRKFYSSF